MRSKVKFGYETETGKEVQIPISHTVITGLSNESGKTTAVMGLIKRSGLRAIIIKTKIGEKAITEGAIIPPFYKEIFDWEYVCELLEANRNEKLKFERSWIIKYSKTATSLFEFKHNIDKALIEDKLRELDKSVLISLQAYLEKILPELQYAPLSKTLDIRDGINIMDLERFKVETQSIIIRSVLDEVLKNEKNTLIVIPECWKYLPEKNMTPVKRPAEAFIRQGATNNNFLFLDSQDVTGVAKSVLKQVSCWILGLQKEKNEIQRTLDQIPLSKKSKPKNEEIPNLKLGQFYVVTSDFTKKCYAQAPWVDDKTAIKIAKGELDVTQLEQPLRIAPYQIVTPTQKTIDMEGFEIERVPDLSTIKKINELRIDFISNKNDFFTKFDEINTTISGIYQDIFKLKNESPKINEDEIVLRVLQKMPMGSGNAKQPIFNKEELILEILARIPKQAGSVTYTIAPLEKIKKDFLEKAKQKIIADVSSLDEEQRKILKFVETQGKGCNQSNILGKCLYLSTTSGGTRERISNKCKEMANLELTRMDKNAVVYPNLRERINSLIGIHEAKPEEIEAVYNHILMEIIGG